MKEFIEINENRNIFAFDFSKDAINVASRGVNDICFFVSDINNIPMSKMRSTGLVTYWAYSILSWAE